MIVQFLKILLWICLHHLYGYFFPKSPIPRAALLSLQLTETPMSLTYVFSFLFRRKHTFPCLHYLFVFNLPDINEIHLYFFFYFSFYNKRGSSSCQWVIFPPALQLGTETPAAAFHLGSPRLVLHARSPQNATPVLSLPHPKCSNGLLQT